MNKRRPSRKDERSQPGERLQKVLAQWGLASRREAEQWIRAGRLSINGEPAQLGARVSAEDQLHLDGRLIRQPTHRATKSSKSLLFICHRSPGESLRDGGEGTALLERLPSRAGKRFIAVSPMPRVDGGLELVTSDGVLASQLQRAVRHLTFEYSVRVHGDITDAQRACILEGELDSGARLHVQSCEPGGGEGSNRWYTVVVRGASGKDIRQLFERQGLLVSRVLRTHFGALHLDRALSRGHFRQVTPLEWDAFMSQIHS